MTYRRTSACALFAALAFVLHGAAAQATTTYTDVVGANFTYTGTAAPVSAIQETSSFGDPEPLFDQPVLSGANGLAFTPSTFIASASGNGGFDQTGSQLQLDIVGNTASDIIEQVLLTEVGTIEFSGSGTSSSGGFVGMSGFVTVLETTSGPISPVVIGFTGTVLPTDFFTMDVYSGTTNWTASALIDVSAQVANATVVRVSWDNDLTVFSETGSTVTLTKTGAGISLPEPATAMLLGVGVLVAALGARREER